MSTTESKPVPVINGDHAAALARMLTERFGRPVAVLTILKAEDAAEHYEQG